MMLVSALVPLVLRRVKAAMLTLVVLVLLCNRLVRRSLVLSISDPVPMTTRCP